MLPPFYYFNPGYAESINNQPLDFINFEPGDGNWIAYWKAIYFYSEQNITEVSNISESSIKVFPNPTTETITINIGTELQLLYFELIDIHGTRILEKVISNNQKMNIKQFSAGLYFYNDYRNNEIIQKGKIIIK